MRTVLRRRMKLLPARAAGLLALCCALMLAAACDGSPTPPTPAPTLTPTQGPSGITQLSIAIAGIALPSPDGTMIAGADLQAGTITIYTLQGAVLGHLTAPPPDGLGYAWLPDSSGLMVWTIDPHNPSPGPLSFLSPQGVVQPIGLPPLTAVPSPDSAWIAADTYHASSSPSIVEVAPSHGGAVRTLASGMGVRFLGWLGNMVVYAANGNIYAIPPSGGAPRLLTSEGGTAWGGGVTSPDGQVLTMCDKAAGCVRLVGAQLLPIPPEIGQAPLSFWIGPHEALGLPGPDDAGGEYGEYDAVIVDMVSGGVVRDTGAKVPGTVEAVSGDWVASYAQTAFGKPETLHFTNLRTTREVDLGPPPNGGGGVYSLGQGKFFLHGNGRSYVLDPTEVGPA